MVLAYHESQPDMLLHEHYHACLHSNCKECDSQDTHCTQCMQTSMTLTFHAALFQKHVCLHVGSGMPWSNNSVHTHCVSIGMVNSICNHSQLLAKSKFVAVPLLTDMIKFSRCYDIVQWCTKKGNELCMLHLIELLHDQAQVNMWKEFSSMYWKMSTPKNCLST